MFFSDVPVRYPGRSELSLPLGCLLRQNVPLIDFLEFNAAALGHLESIAAPLWVLILLACVCPPMLVFRSEHHKHIAPFHFCRFLYNYIIQQGKNSFMTSRPPAVCAI